MCQTNLNVEVLQLHVVLLVELHWFALLTQIHVDIFSSEVYLNGLL